MTHNPRANGMRIIDEPKPKNDRLPEPSYCQIHQECLSEKRYAIGSINVMIPVRPGEIVTPQTTGTTHKIASIPLCRTCYGIVAVMAVMTGQPVQPLQKVIEHE